MDVKNPELQLANDFVKYTDHNIYLTGKAGTGKTTFLHRLKESSPKRMIVTAPTGVAAINAGGVTLHSFFQMPFGPFIPGSDAHQQTQHRKINKEKISIIKSLDLLVIDEISMVRADLLDGVDAILRRYKHRDRPFGGVQLLMIGDLHQLSPVIKDDEWALLKPYYDTGYFFSSNALKQTDMVSIELKHIYRQSDAHFIELLNKVRDNRLDAQSFQVLNTRHIPDFKPKDGENYITLTTHNRLADDINCQRMDSLHLKPFVFKAEIEGDYPENIYPTAEELTLKEGAQVMFVRNDSSTDKKYFNGKIGKIVQIGKEGVSVKCPGDSANIFVEEVTWENIRYTLDEETKEISEKLIGSFHQVPLRMAWAITIHKSQGLTFEHAIIDAHAAFSHGQVYVALSRCKTFEGMVLSTPVSQRAVKTDRTVSQFTHHVSQHLPDAGQLMSAKVAYQQKLLLECFNYKQLHFDLEKLVKLLRQNLNVIQFSGIEAAEQMLKATVDDVFIVAEKFQRQLQSLFVSEEVIKATPQENEKLQERVKKASRYFVDKLLTGIVEWNNNFSSASDNTEVNKKIAKAVDELGHTLMLKLAGSGSCEQGFSIEAYMDALAHAEIAFNSQPDTRKTKPDYSSMDIAHPELLKLLSEWRAKQAEEEAVDRYRIVHQSVLVGIVNSLPDTLPALLMIKGVGKHTGDKYGAQLVAIVAEYCKTHAIEPPPVSQQVVVVAEKSVRPDTKKISYELYLQGKTTGEIAEQRELVESTIEGHLTHYVALGKLNVNDFISAEKLNAIGKVLEENETESMGQIKEQLGEGFSYAEIRMVQAYRKKVFSEIEEKHDVVKF
ncbi:DNA repair and recombination protein, putative helicase [hydrothermal vent metagenome]|uniref:DNA repair and recombination protein, putative helicase n=1 Tax=hydrothermal vent metagenome TaxID=652676 RepID=A0A3B0X9H5_9ZZZZ